MKYIVSIDNGIQMRVVKLVNDATFSKSIEKESQEVYFREKINSPIRLKGDDYDFIYNTPIENKILVNITQTYLNNGIEKSVDYFNGYFSRYDCEFDADNKLVEINVSSNDMYEDLLAGIDDEYDIIKLGVPTKRVQYDKRPIIQIYRGGDTKISNFLGGTYWEEDCNPTTDGNTLYNTYHFSGKDNAFRIVLAGAGIPTEVAGYYVGNVKPTGGFGVTHSGVLRKNKDDDYYIVVEFRAGEYPPVFYRKITVYDVNDLKLFESEIGVSSLLNQTSQTLLPILANGASNTYVATISVQAIYCRWLHNKTGVSGSFNRPTNDITEYNSNYIYIMPYGFSAITVTNNTSNTATKYGRVQENDYYYDIPNSTMFSPKYYPVSRSNWLDYSMWFSFSNDYLSEEILMRQTILLKDAYTLEDTIQLLLNKIVGENEITFANDANHSIFFYDTDPFNRPLGKPIYYPIITPKSNVLKGEYDKPAQKGAITLREVFDMLRDVFNCYWRLEKVRENTRLKIEHIQYFENGGSYDANITSIGVDLTQERNLKSKRYYAVDILSYITGKDFPINTNKWKYDKSDIPTRIEYAFMDNSSEAFNGFPIVMKSNNVTKGKVNKIQSAKFTTDIDMMVSTPEEFNKDGFALMGAEKVVGQTYEYQLPIIPMNINNMNLYLQNGYLAYVYLHPNYFIYNSPTKYININENDVTAVSTNKIKVQMVEFPTQTDLDYTKNIKSGLGIGTIEKINVYLCNRKNEVTLKFNEE